MDRISNESVVAEQVPPADERPDQPAVWDLVIADMQDRDGVGRERYGTPLQPFNGRKPLIDCYQEALDLVVYLRQEIYEQVNAPAGRAARERIGELIRERDEARLKMMVALDGRAALSQERDRLAADAGRLWTERHEALEELAAEKDERADPEAERLRAQVLDFERKMAAQDRFIEQIRKGSDALHERDRAHVDEITSLRRTVARLRGEVSAWHSRAKEWKAFQDDLDLARRKLVEGLAS